MCFILWGSVKYYPFLNLTLQRWGNKKPCATFLCTGYKIKINYLVYRDIQLYWGIMLGNDYGTIWGIEVIFSLAPIPAYL